ncbi:MAG TPA: TlpA disulfide reductase family protein [Acidobacteriaceae bacterium]|nr:TlpA disulfide reductase family protein [Acidobacteriaceae bacterium]
MRAAAPSATRAALTLLAAFLCLPALAARAPNLTLKDLSGARQKLSGLRGHIVVLNFWATWCGPCQQELPRLAQLAQQASGQNVRFVAVSIDDTKDQPKIRPDLDRLHVALAPNFSVWTGSTSYALASFGLGSVVPGTAILDRDGTIVTRIQGEAREADIRATVDWLLNNRSGPPPPALIRRY